MIGALFVLAGLCEIGGRYLNWCHVRHGKPLAWALGGAALLVLYGVVAAFQPIQAFGRAYAGYGGAFVALSLAWGILVEGFVPDGYDILGALVVVCGVLIIVAPFRG